MQQTNIANVYLLVGYLGAGKTTLVQRILNEWSTNKVAVIQNQFAEEMGIQSPLITNCQGTPFQNLVQLPNGCICCSAKNDLLAAIEYLIQFKGVNRIVVETNGVADPAANIKQFWLDENMKLPIRLHSIICIVPAHRFQLLQEQDIFKKQLIFSNKIVIGFIDKVSNDQIERIKETLSQFNPSLEIYKNTEQLLLEKLTQGEFFHLDDLIKIKQQSHSHSTIKSIFIKGLIKCNPKQFEERVGKLLWEENDNIVLRIKGLVIFEGEKSYYSLQGIDEVFQLSKSEVNHQEGLVESKILVIGKNLSRQYIFDLLLK